MMYDVGNGALGLMKKRRRRGRKEKRGSRTKNCQDILQVPHLLFLPGAQTAVAFNTFRVGNPN
jgi:hypothetical protein